MKKKQMTPFKSNIQHAGIKANSSQLYIMLQNLDELNILYLGLKQII